MRNEWLKVIIICVSLKHKVTTSEELCFFSKKKKMFLSSTRFITNILFLSTELKTYYDLSLGHSANCIQRPQCANCMNKLLVCGV